MAGNLCNLAIENHSPKSVHIYDQPLRIDFHPLSRSNYKAPIPFDLFLTVKEPDDAPAEDVSVKLRLDLGMDYPELVLSRGPHLVT